MVDNCTVSQDPTKAQGTDLSKMVIGDFCSILENVLKTRVKSEYSSKTIGEVNQILDALAIAHGQRLILYYCLLFNFDHHSPK